MSDIEEQINTVFNRVYPNGTDASIEEIVARLNQEFTFFAVMVEGLENSYNYYDSAEEYEDDEDDDDGPGDRHNGYYTNIFSYKNDVLTIIIPAVIEGVTKSGETRISTVHSLVEFLAGDEDFYFGSDHQIVDTELVDGNEVHLFFNLTRDQILSVLAHGPNSEYVDEEFFATHYDYEDPGHRGPLDFYEYTTEE